MSARRKLTAGGLVLVSAAVAASLGLKQPCRPVEVRCGDMLVSAQACGRHVVVPDQVLRYTARELHACEFEGRRFSILDGGTP